MRDYLLGHRLPYDSDNYNGGNDLYHGANLGLYGIPIEYDDILARNKLQFLDSNASERSNASTTHSNRTCFFLDEHGDTLEWNSPAFPKLIIVGAQKAGTTAISHLLGKVPTLLRSKQSEPHFWDVAVGQEGHPQRFSTESQKCELKQLYFNYWDSDLMTSDTLPFEKTPSLLALPSTAQDIRALLDPYPPKILVVLRDPIARFFSHYRMHLQRGRLQVPDLEHNLIRELSQLQNMSVIDAPLYSRAAETWNQTAFSGPGSFPEHIDWRWSMVARGFYAPQLERFLQHFPTGELLKVVHYENFTRNKLDGLNDILDWLGVPPHHWSEAELEQDLGPCNITVEYPSMNDNVRSYLQHLYKPFNDKLAALLGEEWRGVWDHS